MRAALAVMLTLIGCSTVPFESLQDADAAQTLRVAEILDEVVLEEPADGTDVSCYPVRAWLGRLEPDADSHDLDRRLAIGLTGGHCPGAGYALQVRQLVDRRSSLQVNARLIMPGPTTLIMERPRAATVVLDDHGWDSLTLKVRSSSR